MFGGRGAGGGRLCVRKRVCVCVCLCVRLFGYMCVCMCVRMSEYECVRGTRVPACVLAFICKSACTCLHAHVCMILFSGIRLVPHFRSQFGSLSPPKQVCMPVMFPAGDIQQYTPVMLPSDDIQQSTPVMFLAGEIQQYTYVMFATGDIQQYTQVMFPAGDPQNIRL